MSKQTATGLDDLTTQAMRTLMGTQCLAYGGLALGGTHTKVQLAAAVSYTIKGVMYTKAITDDLFVHTDLTVQAADTVKYYALCLDSTGTASIIQGTATALPIIPTTKCCIGYLKITTVAVTFTPATDHHEAAGVTTTYNNILVPPVTLA